MSEVVATRRPPGRPRNPAVDAAILDAALDLMTEGGAAAVTYEAIARRAGVTRPAIYRRWKSREGLLADALGRGRERAEDPFADWAVVPLEQVMDWFVDVAPRALSDPRQRNLMAQAIRSAPDLPEARRAYWDTYLKPRRELLALMIERAREDGRVRTDIDADLIEDMLGGALIHKLLLEPEPQTETEIRDYLLRALSALGLQRA